MTSSSLALSFSSALLPSLLTRIITYTKNNNSNNNYTPFTSQNGSKEPNFGVVSCAFAAPPKTSKKSSYSSDVRKRHWKNGEYLGVSETSIPGIYKKPPIKNLKKKLDRKNKAKAWASTVTETLIERIQNKQWFQALEVGLSFFCSGFQTPYPN